MEEDLSQRNFNMLFMGYGFLKSFFVKEDSVPASQALEGKINYIAFCTGVWLEDEDTLYTQAQYTKDW